MIIDGVKIASPAYQRGYDDADVTTTIVMIMDSMCHVRQGHSDQFCTNYGYALRKHVIIIAAEDATIYSVNHIFHNNNKNKSCLIIC